MRKILLAYDGSEPSQRALETVADLARATGAPVTVVSVIPRHQGRIASDPWDTRDDHTRALAEARSRLRERGIEVALAEPVGEPAPEIERIAEEGGYDTVVVGSRGLNGLERFLVGSVSEHVATHAHATVVVVR